MSSPAMTKEAAPDTDARDFLRALHVLFKSVRLYGTAHRRSRDQLQLAWAQLAALEATGHSVVLGVAAQKLLINGEHRDVGPMESGFVRMLSAASISSIQFAAGTTAEGLLRFAQILSTVTPNEQLQTFESEAAVLQGISVNRFRFVAQTGAEKEPLPDTAPPVRVTDGAGHAVVPTSAAGTPPPGISLPEAILASMAQPEAAAHDPAQPAPSAAEDAKRTAAGAPTDAQPIGQVSAEAGWVVEMARRMVERAANGDVLDDASRELLKRLLGSEEAHASAAHDPKALVELAERMAIDYAMQQFASGELKIDGVHTLLQQLGKQIQDLRTVLNVQHEQMTRAGLAPADMAEVLDRQFWASVPEHGKQQVLLSADAWCVPPRNVLSYVQEARARGDAKLADDMVAAYCKCVGSADETARRKAASGIVILADQVSQCAAPVAATCTRDIARQLVLETNPELQKLLAVALAKVVQECCTRRKFGAVEQALAALAHLEKKNAALANELRPRIRVENRLPELIREAVHARRCPDGLIGMMKRMPEASLKAITAEFAKTGRSDVCARLAIMTHTLGEHAIELLVEIFRTGAAEEAASTVGLLSALNMAELEQHLGDRMKNWPVAPQAMAIRQIAASGAEERGRLLYTLLSAANPMVHPLILDEMGTQASAEVNGVGHRLMQIASDADASPFLRVKAIEALGRVNEPDAIPLLRSLILSKKLFSWQHPEELRVAAWHALGKTDPGSRQDPALIAAFKPQEHEMVQQTMTRQADWSRHRRYPRVTPSRPIAGVATTPRGAAPINVEMISLGGGIATRQSHASVAGEGVLDLQNGARHVRAQVLVRELGARRLVFEFIDMSLSERWKLRQWLNPDLATGSEEEKPEAPATFPEDPKYCR